MKRTQLEVSKDIQYLVDLGMKTLYWYLSLILMSMSMMAFGSNIICEIATIGIALVTLWYGLSFIWTFTQLKDTNGVKYFINGFTKCYFKNTWLDKENERLN